MFASTSSYKYLDIVRSDFSIQLPASQPLTPMTKERLFIHTFYSELSVEGFEFHIYGKHPYLFKTWYYPLDIYDGKKCRKIHLNNTPIFIDSLLQWKLNFDTCTGSIYVTGILEKIYE